MTANMCMRQKYIAGGMFTAGSPGNSHGKHAVNQDRGTLPHPGHLNSASLAPETFRVGAASLGSRAAPSPPRTIPLSSRICLH